MRIKIVTGLRLTAIILAVFAIISTGLTITRLDAMAQDGRVINQAGVVRGGSQRLTKLELSGKPSDALIQKIDGIIIGLGDGSSELGLPPASDANFIAKLNLVKNEWENLKTSILAYRTDPGTASALLAQSETFFTTTDDAVKAAEAASAGKVNSAKILQVGLMIFNLAILVVVWVFSQNKIAVPLRRTEMFITLVSSGDLSQDVPPELQGQADEIGNLARMIQLMTDNLRRAITATRQGVDALSETSSGLTNISSDTSNGAQQSAARAHTVAAAAEELSVNSASVADGMERATASLVSAASAVEEMTATIGEIADNSERARSTTDQAARQADDFATVLNELGRAAQEIGKVTETITKVSAQTNLLALNATIEAARAGAAGKGFVVVANEIKELAKQTAAATGDIKNKINSIQKSAGDAIHDIERIVSVIKNVNNLVIAIAAAIEEQAIVARSVTENLAQASNQVRDANDRVSQTATVTREIAQDVSMVSSTASEMTTAAAAVQARADDLTRLAEELSTITGQFYVG